MPIDWDFSKRIAIRNLGESATKNEIDSLFGKCGKINKLWVARNPPGLAFLEYEKRREAETAALYLDGVRCCGSRVKVDLSIGCPSNSRSRSSSRGYDLRRSARRQDVDAESNNRNRRTSKRQRRECSSCNENVDEPTSSKCIRRSSQQQPLKAKQRSRSRISDSQRLDCSICFDNVIKRDPTVTPCFHVFCSACIRKAIAISGKCPICQTDIVASQLKPIYLCP